MIPKPPTTHPFARPEYDQETLADAFAVAFLVVIPEGDLRLRLPLARLQPLKAIAIPKERPAWIERARFQVTQGFSLGPLRPDRREKGFSPWVLSALKTIENKPIIRVQKIIPSNSAQKLHVKPPNPNQHKQNKIELAY